MPRPPQESPYGKVFWRAYVANSMVMVAVALLFRYADFVAFLGGTELHLGWIVGVGMVGSLAMRFFLGVAIDHYGPRVVWLSSLVLFAVSCLAHLGILSYQGPAIYLLRVSSCCAIAGIFGASMTFVSGRAPTVRMAEMIGMLGTSGFVGMVLGTQLGDLLLGTESIERWQVDRMFVVAGLLGACALVFAGGATRGLWRRPEGKRPPLVWLLKRYHPGSVLLVGVAMGAGLGLPGSFLRTYAADLGISRIALFFTVYAPTAIVVRLGTRRLPERLGAGPMILAGLVVLAASQLLLVAVRSEWMLIVPGIGYGIAHAVLFPCTVAAGASAFPDRYRGLGTTLMLATFDLGLLIGAPAAGLIVHFAGAVGLPSYPTLYASMAVTFVLIAGFYGRTLRRDKQTSADLTDNGQPTTLPEESAVPETVPEG
jgi:MFS family permease